MGLAGCTGVAACLGVHQVWPRLSDRGPWADGSPRRGTGLLSLRLETSGPVGGESSVPGVWSVGRGLTGVRLDLQWPPRCLRVSPCVVIPFRPSWGLCVPCVPVDFFRAGMTCRRQRRCPPSWYRAFLNILTESCLVPGWGERSGRGMSFLRGWSVGAHGAWRPWWGLTSFHLCLYEYGAAWLGSRLSCCRYSRCRWICGPKFYFNSTFCVINGENLYRSFQLQIFLNIDI